MWDGGTRPTPVHLEACHVSGEDKISFNNNADQEENYHCSGTKQKEYGETI